MQVKTQNETQAAIWHVLVGEGSGVLSTEALRLQVDYSGQGSPCMFPRYNLSTAERFTDKLHLLECVCMLQLTLKLIW